ncbi:hypothetical protein [Isoptericola sp. AK164]|uniref:hypothetical protein n=1 Tax=Isoptericola sp. AK164 TaxID=3024246 RepID=UPI00241853C4|nr:hypothetical protein [Isoptericola sp. AK164]
MAREHRREGAASGTRITPAAVGLVGVVLVAGACSGPEEAFAEPMAEHALFDDVAFSPTSLTATLPQVTYRDGSSATTFSDLVVAGEITGWQRGRATDWSTDGGREVAWSGDADSREVVVALEVDEVVAAGDDDLDGVDVAPGDTIEVVATLGGDADAAGDALAGLGDVVVLVAHGPGEHRDEWWVGLGGILLGDLDDGDLTWPVLEAAGGDLDVRDDVADLDALRRAAEAAPRTIAVGDS